MSRYDKIEEAHQSVRHRSEFRQFLPSKEKPARDPSPPYNQKGIRAKQTMHDTVAGRGRTRNSRSGAEHHSWCSVERMLSRDGIHWSQFKLFWKKVRTSFRKHSQVSEFVFSPKFKMTHYAPKSKVSVIRI